LWLRGGLPRADRDGVAALGRQAFEAQKTEASAALWLAAAAQALAHISSIYSRS
jgi:hypothetical protein